MDCKSKYVEISMSDQGDKFVCVPLGSPMISVLYIIDCAIKQRTAGLYSTLITLCCQLYNVHSILHPTLYIVHSTLITVQCTVH